MPLPLGNSHPHGVSIDAVVGGKIVVAFVSGRLIVCL
jgi:hypothetical protein